uniref:Secreted protein n=1 Tax=Steinernema glaseri TaxID=37863 RepID=A0A1I7YLI3_9BILA
MSVSSVYRVYVWLSVSETAMAVWHSAVCRKGLKRGLMSIWRSSLDGRHSLISVQWDGLLFIYFFLSRALPSFLFLDL